MLLGDQAQHPSHAITIIAVITGGEEEHALPVRGGVGAHGRRTTCGKGVVRGAFVGVARSATTMLSLV